jgi:hypothetical protein
MPVLRIMRVSEAHSSRYARFVRGLLPPKWVETMGLPYLLHQWKIICITRIDPAGYRDRPPRARRPAALRARPA